MIALGLVGLKETKEILPRAFQVSRSDDPMELIHLKLGVIGL